jgi:hypothetical protein
MMPIRNIFSFAWQTGQNVRNSMNNIVVSNTRLIIKCSFQIMFKAPAKLGLPTSRPAFRFLASLVLAQPKTKPNFFTSP